MTSGEVLNQVLNLIQILGLAAIAAWAEHQRRKLNTKTEEWEEMTHRAISASEETKDLVLENRDLTKEVEKKADGINVELAAMAARSNYLAGRMKEKLLTATRQERPVTQDELDTIETQFLTPLEELQKKGG